MEIIVHYYILILGLVLILSLPETLILNRTNTTNYSYKNIHITRLLLFSYRVEQHVRYEIS